jgi:hypothetical protein
MSKNRVRAISQGPSCHKGGGFHLSLFLKFDQSQEWHILNSPIGNLGDLWEKNVNPIVLSQ